MREFLVRVEKVQTNRAERDNEKNKFETFCLVYYFHLFKFELRRVFIGVHCNKKSFVNTKSLLV